MWRQTRMWRQGEMWRQTMWCQNVVSDTALTKQFFMKCVFSGRRKRATLYACARSLSARDVAISASGRSKYAMALIDTLVRIECQGTFTF